MRDATVCRGPPSGLRLEPAGVLSRGSRVRQFEGTLPLDVELGAVTTGREDRVRVPLEIQVPLARVTLLPRGEKLAADLELRVEVLDDLGRRSEVSMIPVHLTGDRAPAPGERALYRAELEVRREAGRGGGALRPGDRPALRDPGGAHPAGRPGAAEEEVERLSRRAGGSPVTVQGRTVGDRPAVRAATSSERPIVNDP